MSLYRANGQENPFHSENQPIAYTLYESLIKSTTPEVLDLSGLRRYFASLCDQLLKFDFADNVEWLIEQDLLDANSAQKLKEKRQVSLEKKNSPEDVEFIKKIWMSADFFSFKNYLNSLNLE